MKATEQEMTAARQLAEAVVGFVIALQHGSAQRADQDRQRATQSARWDMYPESRLNKPNEHEIAKKAAEFALLTTRDAAKLMAISNRSLWELTHPRGPIPVVRMGHSIRYALEDLKSAIQELKNSPPRTRPRKSKHEN